MARTKQVTRRSFMLARREPVRVPPYRRETYELKHQFASWNPKHIKPAHTKRRSGLYRNK